MNETNPSKPDSSGQRSGRRRRRKRIRSSPRELQKRFSWDGPGGGTTDQQPFRRGLIIFGGMFLIAFLGLGYLSYNYYKRHAKKPSAPPTQVNQIKLPGQNE
ncbi:MAG: hypothetical protein AAGK14_11320 [Verrucomicrobiota bacterium]